MKKTNWVMLACAGMLGFQAARAADVTTTGGTTGDIPVFTGTSAIGNSIMTQSGTTVKVGGSVNATGSFQIGGNQAQSQNSTYETIGIGPSALSSTSTGDYNVAAGWSALPVNTTGTSNTALGNFSLFNNSTGSYNQALGNWALHQNTTGGNNTAIGLQALYYVTTGSNNIGIGGNGGYSLTTGSYNIDIGTSGLAADSGAIRIGDAPNQTSFYAAGIYGVTTALTGAVEVFVDSAGQLGTKSSSLRYKEDVHDMAGASDGLFRLRPVTYRYKQPYADGSKPIDYGLIAEEVAQVYPDLVAKNTAGQVETVEYSKLTPMLVNELQKQHQVVEQQAETIRSLEERLAALEQEAAKK